MKVIEVTRRTADQHKCGHCDRRLHEGQQALEWVKVDPVTLYEKIRVLTHVECVREVIANVPREGSKEAFESLRREMATSGLVFPS